MKKFLVLIILVCFGMCMADCSVSARTVRKDHPVEIINKHNHGKRYAHRRHRRTPYYNYVCKNGICRWTNRPAPAYTHSASTTTPPYANGAGYVRPRPKYRPPMPEINPHGVNRPAVTYSFSAR